MRRSLVTTAAALIGLAIPQSAFADPPPLEAYGALPSVEDIAISPDGNRIATATRIAEARRLLVVGLDGKAVFHAELGASKVRGVRFASDDILLVDKSTTTTLGDGFTSNKTEAFGALIIPLTTGKPELVFARTRRIIGAVYGQYGVRQTAKGPFGYFGGVELKIDGVDTFFEHGRPALFEVDLTKNGPVRIGHAPSEGIERDWLVDAQGKIAAQLDITDSTGAWEIEGPTGQTIASGVNKVGSVWLICLGKDGTSVIYGMRDEQRQVRWLEAPLAGGESRGFLTDITVARMFVDRNTGHLLGYATEGTSSKPILFDPVRQKAMTKIYKAFGKQEFSFTDWTPDFAKVIVRTSGSNDSGTYYLVDVPALKAEAIAFERPKIAPADVGPVSVIDYKAADGLEMDGILTLPPGREAKNLPVIMLPHGGPHAEDSPVFDWWAQAFASRGYAVFQPNFRGSTNRDDAFRNASANEWGRKMQTDISDGMAELAKRGIVDPKRACIMGASYGGYAALAGVTLQQGLYRCAVAVAPVSDLEMIYDTDVRESGDSLMTARALKQDLGDRKGFEAVSPRRFAVKADAPILLIHGKDDTVVPFRQSEVMASALRSAGKPYELVTLKREDHWLSLSETRLQMLTEALRFVQKHNPAD